MARERSFCLIMLKEFCIILASLPYIRARAITIAFHNGISIHDSISHIKPVSRLALRFGESRAQKRRFVPKLGDGINNNLRYSRERADVEMQSTGI
jgi:hypothetical protein